MGGTRQKAPKRLEKSAKQPEKGRKCKATIEMGEQSPRTARKPVKQPENHRNSRKITATAKKPVNQGENQQLGQKSAVKLHSRYRYTLRSATQRPAIARGQLQTLRLKEGMHQEEKQALG